MESFLLRGRVVFGLTDWDWQKIPIFLLYVTMAFTRMPQTASYVNIDKTTRPFLFVHLIALEQQKSGKAG